MANSGEEILLTKQKTRFEYIKEAGSNNAYVQGVPEIVPRLCGCCGGVVNLIISVFTQLHRSGFNLEFETPYESI